MGCGWVVDSVQPIKATKPINHTNQPHQELTPTNQTNQTTPTQNQPTKQTINKQTQVHDAFDELGELVQEAALDGEGEDGFDDFFDADGDEEGEDGGFDDDDLSGVHSHDVEDVVGEMLQEGAKQARRKKEEL
jgi:hypothetical protein